MVTWQLMEVVTSEVWRVQVLRVMKKSSSPPAGSRSGKLSCYRWHCSTTALTISPPWSVCSSVVCKHYSALCDLQFKQLSRGASAAMTGQALYNLTVCIRKWSLHKKYVVIDHHCYYLVLTLYAMQKYIYLILYLHTNGASFAFIT